MKQVPLESLTIFELTARIEKAASLHGQATERGDYRVGNKQYDLLVSLHKELKRRGGEGRAAILSLMRSEDIGVRLWASTRALRFAPGLAEPALEEIASIPRSLNAFTAQMTLEEWRKGNLKLDD